MPIVLDGTAGITTPTIAATSASTFTGALALPAGGLNVGSGQLAVDASGRVTMSSQPAFHVRVNNSAYITTSPIPFSNVVFDVGSNFNTSTYRFTAPVAGKYYMVLNLYLRLTNNEDGYPRFRVNGSNAGRPYSYFYNIGTGGQIDVTLALNAVFNLAVGDYVDIEFNSGTGGDYFGGTGEANFYGFLVG